MTHPRPTTWLAPLALVALALGCAPRGAERAPAPAPEPTPQRLELAFVINSPSDFWTLARAGIRRAEAEFDVSVDFQVPGNATAAEQRQIIETLIARGVKGMAVSVLDPVGAVGILDQAAARMPVITQDSDCPESKRIAYIGTDNVEAGRVAGREILEALPEGGEVALFVGKMDVANAVERKRGIDEVLEGSGVTVVEVLTDEGQRAVAQNNVRNALDKYPGLAGLVGLWSYNTPAIVKVVEEKGLQGKIRIVGFDEEKPTLDGIEDGTVLATVVQQPYEFGYRSIRALAMLARGQDPGLPPDGLAYVPVEVIDRTNIAAFRERIERLRAEGEDSRRLER